VAADPRLQRIDSTRRIEAEIHATGGIIGAPRFREERGRSGRGIIVAVIDTEVAARHPAFQDRVVLKENYTEEPWGTPGRHGTAVAGIVAARSEQILGMAPDATVYNYKVIATNRFLNSDDFGGALALQQALEDGAHVANCSWGAGPAMDGLSREARACNAAWDLGMLIVKSAGNRGPGGGTLTTPADADGVIVVGATGRDGTSMGDYSSRGPTGHTPGRSRPHLVAPGGLPEDGIHSCLVQGGFGDCGHGTSFAAPHVSGLLALLLEEDPNQTPDELREALLRLCTPLAGHDGNSQGGGVVSLAGLL
jgi:serine protease AprX